MKICVIGTGYVGLTVGTCLANFGNYVTCVDIDKEKIEKLKHGIIPIYEPGLDYLVKFNIKENRLFFTTDSGKAIQENDIIFIAVGTPTGENNKADLSAVFKVAETIGKNLNNYKVIVDKSTVPVGTAEKVKNIIKKYTDKKFDVVSNPEFLKEGTAIKDFNAPDRIIIGAESEQAINIMKQLYKVIERTNRPILITNIKTAEIIKYASNAMLALRISFMNELSHLCEKTGGNIKEVAKGIGLDSRIGPRFLQAGAGYGGSCFPKDVKALIETLKENECDAKILEAVEYTNQKQKEYVAEKTLKLLGDDKKVAIWGLSFKPKTDDMREAPSIVVINKLLENNKQVIVFDPVAMDNAKKIFGDKIQYVDNSYEAVKGVDLLVLITEWDEFRSIDKNKIKILMNKAKIFDARNIYDPQEMKEEGFEYYSIGR